MQVRNASSEVMKETDALSRRTQSANTKKLTERLHDINYWKSELRREIGDMITETDLLCQQKLRLENALRATEIPLHIVTDNLHCRQRRQGIDLVQDNVEIYLLKVRLSMRWSYGDDTRPRNLRKKLAPMHVTKIPLFDWSAVFESFWYKKLARNRAAFYSVQVSFTSFLSVCHPHYLHT